MLRLRTVAGGTAFPYRDGFQERNWITFSCVVDPLVMPQHHPADFLVSITASVVEGILGFILKANCAA